MSKQIAKKLDTQPSNFYKSLMDFSYGTRPLCYGRIGWKEDHYEVIKHTYLKFLFEHFPLMTFADLMEALAFGDSDIDTGYYDECELFLSVDVEKLEKFLIEKGYL